MVNTITVLFVWAIPGDGLLLALHSEMTSGRAYMMLDIEPRSAVLALLPISIL